MRVSRWLVVLALLVEPRVDSLPLPHDDPESSSVRCLNTFAWDLERVHQGMNFSVFEHFPLADGSYLGQGGRKLPPRGRAYTFASAFRHFERNGGKVVVELGTTRSFRGDGLRNDGVNAGCFDGGCTPEEVHRWWHPDDPSFWDWGAGFFGRLAALCLGHLGVEQHQVDFAEAHILRAQAINSDMQHVMYYHSTSEAFLESFEGQIDLLYLDTGDVSPIEPTALLHKREAEIIIKRDLVRPGGIILIDDVLHPTPLQLKHDPQYPELHAQPISALGKAKYSIPLLLENGYEMLENEFQVLLRRQHPPPRCHMLNTKESKIAGDAASRTSSDASSVTSYVSAQRHSNDGGDACLRIQSPQHGARVFRPGNDAIAWLDFSLHVPSLSPPLQLSVTLMGAGGGVDDGGEGAGMGMMRVHVTDRQGEPVCSGNLCSMCQISAPGGGGGGASWLVECHGWLNVSCATGEASWGRALGGSLVGGGGKRKDACGLRVLGQHGMEVSWVHDTRRGMQQVM